MLVGQGFIIIAAALANIITIAVVSTPLLPRSVPRPIA